MELSFLAQCGALAVAAIPIAISLDWQTRRAESRHAGPWAKIDESNLARRLHVLLLPENGVRELDDKLVRVNRTTRLYAVGWIVVACLLLLPPMLGW